jgi:hypothetical protein
MSRGPGGQRVAGRRALELRQHDIRRACSLEDRRGQRQVLVAVGALERIDVAGNRIDDDQCPA